MTAAESKGLKKGSRVYWRGDATDGGRITEISWDAVRSPGTMVRWQEYTMGTCAKFSKRQQSRLLCRYCVRPVECPFLSTKTTYGATGEKDLLMAQSFASAIEATPPQRFRRLKGRYDTRPFRKSYPDILMMQPGQDGQSCEDW